jgi:hypothetical protein
MDSLDVLSELSHEQVGQLFIAMRDYNNDEEVKLEGLLKAVFIPFKNQFDRDAEKYEAIVLRNRENGKNGGKPKKTQTNPVGILGTQPNPDKPDNDSDSKSDSKSDSDNESDSGITPLPPEGELSATPPEEEKPTPKRKQRSQYTMDDLSPEFVEKFEAFRKSYPGEKRGLKIEILNLVKKHADFEEVMDILPGCMENMRKVREQQAAVSKDKKLYIPSLAVWINQRAWEKWIPENLPPKENLFAADLSIMPTSEANIERGKQQLRYFWMKKDQYWGCTKEELIWVYDFLYYHSMLMLGFPKEYAPVSKGLPGTPGRPNTQEMVMSLLKVNYDND